MAVPVDGFDAFIDHYEYASKHTDLFGFLLYSNRQSHEPVAEFARSARWFLNELAVNQGMYIYFFVLDTDNAARNPAAQVSSTFDVPFSNLPGMLLFGKSGGEKNVGLFFHIDEDLFKDRNRAEERLTELFGKIDEARSHSAHPQRMIEELSRDLPAWERSEKLRPLWDYFRKQALQLVNLPSDIVKQVAEGFAKGLVSNG